jgi:phytanoyl-CoA hydroxylase
VFREERNGKPKQLQNLHVYRPEFFIDRLYKEKAPPLALKLTDGREPFMIKNVQLFVKHPSGASGPTRVHQDDWYFKLDPSRMFALTVWIALDDANETGGCLRYATGSHMHGAIDHEPNKSGCWRTRSGVEGFAGYVPNVQLNELDSPVPVKRGDAVIHHCRTLHGAGANTSAHNRRALTFILFFMMHDDPNKCKL